MNEQELNKKLAEYFGLEYDNSWIKDPDTGQWHINWLTQSLDACFKWLVPKAIEYIRTVVFKGVSEPKAREALFMFWLKEGFDALALCLAIDKLIDGGK